MRNLKGKIETASFDGVNNFFFLTYVYKTMTNLVSGKAKRS